MINVNLQKHNLNFYKNERIKYPIEFNSNKFEVLIHFQKE